MPPTCFGTIASIVSGRTCDGAQAEGAPPRLRFELFPRPAVVDVAFTATPEGCVAGRACSDARPPERAWRSRAALARTGGERHAFQAPGRRVGSHRRRLGVNGRAASRAGRIGPPSDGAMRL